jgi:outer membrane protein assembly factor BamE (lipoprotein component of BamABCDE complex)
MGLQKSPKLWLLIALVVVCVGLAACAVSKINQENFDKIKTGMSQGEVQAILGEPTESSSVDMAVFSGTASTWKRGDITITVQFVNGKVVSKQFAKTSR